ncbi:MAG: A/G-specific adenine glycosylase [Bacillota bacterium]
MPWRKTRDPYRILVSEVMLQQTQVERVKPFYEAWLKRFPTIAALAKAPLRDVLTVWQGLGYNRRAKMLHEAAKALTAEGKVPKTAEELQKLPGIGPYTARAVIAFAHNADTVFIETNIRTAVMHHFFPRKKQVSDKEILSILEKAHPTGKSREWYAALMDYGAYLKRNGVRLNARTKGYTKQKTFSGSSRQARGAILKELVKGRSSKARLVGLFGDDRKLQLEEQLAKLVDEGMVQKRGISYTLP